MIQNDIGNRFSPTLIVATITTKIAKKANIPTHYLLKDNPAFREPSVAMLEQIRTIDKKRISNYLGKATKHEMKEIDRALITSLALGYLCNLLSENDDAPISDP